MYQQRPDGLGKHWQIIKATNKQRGMPPTTSLTMRKILLPLIARQQQEVPVLKLPHKLLKTYLTNSLPKSALGMDQQYTLAR